MKYPEAYQQGREYGIKLKGVRKYKHGDPEFYCYEIGIMHSLSITMISSVMQLEDLLKKAEMI